MWRFLFVLLIISFKGVTQNNTQTIRGIITEKLTQTPIPGAMIQILSLQKGVVSDSLGRFSLKNIPPNRYEIRISSVGFKNSTLSNVMVISGKEVILEIQLEETFNQLNEVVIKASNKGGTINKLASVSARTFSMEEVNRYAGGRSDPARLAANFAGVSAPDDSRNDIVIRGNSPVGVLWRIDGMNVTNPNHFASVGTTGGAVSALNTNLLKNSDFLTSAFPAEYGNAIAGVFDLGFREGNNKKRETTLQVGVITGIEATTEGPFSKKSDASYVLGYRYSLAGIAQNMGIDIGTTALPSYQDLSFKMSSGTSKWGKFSWFGIGATSTIGISGGPSNSLYGNGNQLDFASKIGITGFNHFKQLSAKSFLSSTLGINYSSNDQTSYDFDRLDNVDFIKEVNNVAKTSYNVSTTFHSKLNVRTFLKVGIRNEVMDLYLQYKTKNRAKDSYVQLWDYSNSTNLAQVFAHLKYDVSERLTMNVGLNSQLFSLNNSSSVEPRVGLIYTTSDNSSLHAGYGLNAQLQPINVYFLTTSSPGGTKRYTNMNLDFTKSHHWVLGYNLQPGKDWRIKTETYYQSIYQVPITSYSSSYSMLNTGATFKTDLQDSLINAGTGRNYGVEFTLEKFFSRGYYGLLTTSFYDAKYMASDGVERNTAFNGKYIFNVLGGKEWAVGPGGANKISLDLKYTNAGGRAFTPIDLAKSKASGREQQSTAEYASFYENYYRLDLKVGFTLNSANKNRSHTLSLDLQNVTNHKNIFSQNYDNKTQTIQTKYQLGFFPNVVYKLQF